MYQMLGCRSSYGESLFFKIALEVPMCEAISLKIMKWHIFESKSKPKFQINL